METKHDRYEQKKNQINYNSLRKTENYFKNIKRRIQLNRNLKEWVKRVLYKEIWQWEETKITWDSWASYPKTLVKMKLLWIRGNQGFFTLSRNWSTFSDIKLPQRILRKLPWFNHAKFRKGYSLWDGANLELLILLYWNFHLFFKILDQQLVAGLLALQSHADELTISKP